MQSKISLKASLFIVVIAGFVCASVITFSPTLTLPSRSSSMESASPPEREDVGLPVRIRIPKINVDATIVYVGLTPLGAMDAPKNQADAAWFLLGQRPGENGNAVIAGHYGWVKGKGSVFDNLYTLRKGDKVYIEDDKGETISFVVRETRRYDPKADAEDVFGSNDGAAHLNLVTCEGVWEETEKTLSSRLVVFTDKVEDEIIEVPAPHGPNQ